jgi:hypothetical protein
VNRRAKAYIRAGGGRLAIAPDRVVLLRPLGDRYVVEYDHAHVRAGEHAFTTHRPRPRPRSVDGVRFDDAAPAVCGLLAWIPEVSVR